MLALAAAGEALIDQAGISAECKRLESFSVEVATMEGAAPLDVTTRLRRALQFKFDGRHRRWVRLPCWKEKPWMVA